MSLLFLGAPDFRLSGQRLDTLKVRFSRLTVETARSVVKLYRSRKAPERQEVARTLIRVRQQSAYAIFLKGYKPISATPTGAIS